LRILLLLFISLNTFSDVSFGELENFVIESDYDTREIQIYYPNNKIIDSDTLFIFMNDGEELFNAAESWHNMEWGIDEKIEQMNLNENELNFVIIGIQSAKKGNRFFVDETKRYAEYFPKESIPYFDSGFKKRRYQEWVNRNNLYYLEFLTEDVIPFVENKFDISLNNKNLGIIGASMGGLAALNALIEYPDLFGFAGCISTHWVGIKPLEYFLLPLVGKIDGDDDTANAIISYIEDNITNIDDQKIYFDHGTIGLDSLYSTPQRRVNKILDSKSKDYKYLVFEGYDHYAPEFGSRFDSVLEYLVIN
tara:strand:+ start:466 stop:1386 length:921 start_codon:yes stop_codon:yes gene_type:complete